MNQELPPPTPTQTQHPWRATIRTVFQAIVALALVGGVIVETLGLDADIPIVALFLGVTAGITKVMAMPVVESWLRRFVPWLAAEPN